MDDIAHDAAIAAAVMLVNLFQTSPGATTPLVAQAVVIVGEAIKAVQVFGEAKTIEPSVN